MGLPSTAAYELNTSTHGTVTYHSPPSGTSFPTSLTITPSPAHATDIWRKPGPPEISTFNAPILYRKFPLSKFQSVRVRVSAKWRAQYDQGGLVILLPEGGGNVEGVASDGDGEALGKRSRWVKTGIELLNSQLLVGTVVRDRWADWSLYPDGIRTFANGDQGVELLIERAEKDDTLWIYVIGDRGERAPVREVTWVLSEGSESGEDREVWVGVYAATPTGMEDGSREELQVSFEGLEWSFRE